MKKTKIISKVIGFLVMLILLITFLLIELYVKNSLTQKIFETLISITFGFTFAFTINFNLNINAKNINILSKTTINEDSLNDEENEQIKFLKEYFPNLVSLENDVKQMKKLRDKNEFNKIVDLRNEISNKIKSQKETLSYITRNDKVYEKAKTYLKVYENYHSEVEKLLNTIDSDKNYMQINQQLFKVDYYNGFDDVYDEIKDIKVILPMNSDN